MAKRRVGNQPLKFWNHPELHACKWCATYHWKFSNKGYKFSSNLISIKGLHKKLWVFKVAGVPISRISRQKWHLGVAPMASHKEYYKGEGDGFPQVRAMVSFVCPCMLVAHPCTKSFSTMHWPTCCRSIWIIEPLVICHNLHLETSTHPFYPNVPQIR